MATDFDGFIYDINMFPSILTNHGIYIQIWNFFSRRWFDCVVTLYPKKKNVWDNQVSNEFFPLSIGTIHKGILSLCISFHAIPSIGVWSRLYNRINQKKYFRSTIEAKIELENQKGFCLKCVMFVLNVLSSWNTFPVLFRRITS